MPSSRHASRRPVLSTTARLFAAGILSTSIACGGGEPAPQPAPAAPVTNPVDAATAATVTGHVTFAGKAPAAEPISMASDPRCTNPGAATEAALVGADGSLQNAFVYVKDGLGGLKFPVPAAPVVLDQKGCQYRPHVFGVQVGQSVEILNSDATLHNIHAWPMTNQEFNVGQALQGLRHTHTFSTTEVMVPFKCDVHKWMNAFVGVLDHPFFAVTAADGSFSLKGLPPGTYTVEAWHEKFGTQTLSVTVGASETKDMSLAFAG
jgi:plastocyanin